MTRYIGTFNLADRPLYVAIYCERPGSRKAVRGPLRIIATYVITGPNGQAYIGATSDFFKRWAEHLNKLRKGTHTNDRLQTLFDAHEEAAFTISIMETFETTNDLDAHEQAATLSFDDELRLNYKVGKDWAPGMHPNANRGRRLYEPLNPRGRNSVARWFDFIGDSKVRHG